jgi:formamidase
MSGEARSDQLRFAVACCQTDFPCPRQRSEIASRVDRMLEMVDGAVVGYRPFSPVRLVVFPEFAHAAPIYATARELRERLAVPLPNEHTDRYAARARALGIYIQTGTFLESDPRWPGVVFNTTCLVGPEGVLCRYRKTHPWIPWEVCASPHDIPGYDEEPFPVARTPIGNIGAAICYDWLFPEAIRQLAANGAEVLVRVSAYMDPWGATPPLDWWTLVNRTRAIENVACVVAANQGASFRNYPPFSWPGGSMVVDHEGRVLAQADPGAGEKIVVAEIDLAAVRAVRGRRLGHRGLEHLRSELYPVYRTPHYPAGTFPAADPEGDRSVEENEKQIREVLEGPAGAPASAGDQMISAAWSPAAPGTASSSREAAFPDRSPGGAGPGSRT